MVGTGQLHVVQRLPARQLDLAGVEKIHRPRPRPLAAGYSQKTRVHQRKKSLRHRHPAPVAIGSSQTVAVSWRAGGRKQSDSAPFFSRRLLKRPICFVALNSLASTHCRCTPPPVDFRAPRLWTLLSSLQEAALFTGKI